MTAEGFGEESRHADFKTKVSSPETPLTLSLSLSLCRSVESRCTSGSISFSSSVYAQELLHSALHMHRACAFLGGPVRHTTAVDSGERASKGGFVLNGSIALWRWGQCRPCFQGKYKFKTLAGSSTFCFLLFILLQSWKYENSFVFSNLRSVFVCD